MRKENLLKDAGVILIALFMVLTNMVVTGTGEFQGAILEVTTDKTFYILGEPVTIFLTNVGDETLSAGGPIITIYDSEDEIVYQEGCYCWYELGPGEYVTWPAWEQTNQQGDQVPVGCYIVEGFLSGFDENYVDDATFYISDDESSSPPNNPDTPMGPTDGEEGVSYTYSTSTIDPDGDMIRYGWEYTGDNTIEKWTNLYNSDTQCSIQLVFDDPGTYSLRVMAEDENGAQSDWSQALGVVIENEPLTVDAEGPYEGNIMEDIEFDSIVTGGIPPYEYLWDYGDGNTSSGDPHPTHNYGNAGNYTVMLTVTDSEDDTASDTTWTYINAPPKTPIIDGPQHGKEGLKYIYTATTTDPDDNQIFYIWNFSDSSELIETLTPLDSGEICKLNHIFTEKGDYTLRVKARDIYDAESEWSDPLEISMPKNKVIDISLFIQNFIQRFPFMVKILKQIIL
jgi:PKD repeat protein